MKQFTFFSSFASVLFFLAGASYFFLSSDAKAGAVISIVRTENIMGPGAQVMWTTDVPADSRVAYGTNTSFGSFSNSRCDAGGYVISHCVNLTGLSPNTVYYYKVESMNISNVDSQLGGFQFTSAPGSTDTSDIIIPSVPAGLVATAISSSQINLSWTASTDNVGVVGYKVYRGDTLLGTVTAASYADTAVTEGVSYNYAVSAYDAAGNSSALSVLASATTPSLSTTTTSEDTTAPNIADVAVHNIISSGAQIKWTTDDLSGSAIMFGTSPGMYSFTSDLRCDAGGNVVSHCVSLSDLTSATTYYYRAVSKNSSELLAKSLEYSFVSASNSIAVTATTTTALSSVAFSVNLGTPLCREGYSVTPVFFTVNPATGGSFIVNDEPLAVSKLDFLRGTEHVWRGVSNAGYAISGPKYGIVSISTADACSAVITAPGATPISTTTTTTIAEKPPAHIALWKGDTYIMPGQIVTGKIRINAGVENADGVSFYLKMRGMTEPKFLGTAIRAIDRPALWRFFFDSASVPDGEAIISMRVKNTAGEYAGNSVTIAIKNNIPENMASADTHSEAVSITNELFAHSENAEAAKVFLREKIEKFLQTHSVEEKQRAAEKLREELALDVLVSDTGETKVQVGTTTISRQKEPERVVEEISQMVKNREGVSILEDTDKDTISDYDETHIYNTNPKKADSDGDKIDDGEEILIGMNPLKNEVALLPRENPKEIVIAAKADPKEFTIDKIELLPAASTEKESVPKQHVAFQGTALPNSFITIYIFSTPVVVTVKTDSDGKWNYTMDKELENGNHEIYVAMTESAGKIIVKSDAIPFVKTAQAATLSSDFALAATAPLAETPAGFFRGGTLALSFVVLLVILGLSFMIISFVSRKKDDSNV